MTAKNCKCSGQNDPDVENSLIYLCLVYNIENTLPKGKLITVNKKHRKKRLIDHYYGGHCTLSGVRV